MQNIDKKMWALVKWIGDKDDKTFTVGIDVTHIKDFDLEAFDNEDVDPNQIYVVEWHNAKKEPLGGWPCYNAMVIAVSGSKLKLEKKLQSLDGIKSPGPSSLLADDVEKNNNCNDGNGSITEFITIDNGDENLETGEPSKKKMRIYDAKTNNNEDTIHVDDEDDVAFKLLKGTSDEEIDKSMKQPDVPQKIQTHEQTDQFVTIDALRTALADVMGNVNKKLDQFLNQPSTSSDLKETHLPNGKKESSVMSTNIKMKELGQKRSGVFITRHQWKSAKSRNTFTAMTTSLLVSVFSEETLLISNYKGGKSKIQNKQSMQYKALDPKIIDVIKECVQAQHPASFKNKDFETAINTKCAKLREAEQKKKLQKETQENEQTKRDQ